jgi:PleD family two-component response regulator
VVALARFDRQLTQGSLAEANACAIPPRDTPPQDWHPEALSRLSRLARIIRGIIRSSDRLGIFDAETIMIAMPYSDHETAMARADRIRMSLAYNFDCESSSGRANIGDASTISISLASSSTHSTIAEMLQANCNQLRKAVRSGGNQTLYTWQECFSVKVKN